MNNNKNNDNQIEKLVYSVSEVSKALNIGINKTYELLQKCEIPSVRVGRKFLIPKDGVIKWLNKLSEVDHFSDMKNYDYKAM